MTNLTPLDHDTTAALRQLLSSSYWRTKSDEVLARHIGVEPAHVARARRLRPSVLTRAGRNKVQP